jgi:hypothetical protein
MPEIYATNSGLPGIQITLGMQEDIRDAGQTPRGGDYAI